MTKKAHILFINICGLLFFTLDQFAKFFARTNTGNHWYIIRPWVGWEYFENTGIAFSIPFSNTILIIVTPIIVFFILLLLRKAWIRNQVHDMYAYAFIISGALSNFVDRLFFGFTIDYFRLFTSIINIGDVLIVVGIIVLAYEQYLSSKDGHEQSN